MRTRIPERARPWITAAALLSAATRLPAQSPDMVMPDSVRGYIRDAMTAFRQRAVHRDEVDWPALEDSVVARSVGAQRPADTWRALTWALRRVDRHSFLMPPPGRMAELTGGMTPSAAPAVRRPTAHREYAAVPQGLLDGRIGVVVVPGHEGPNRPAYVDSIQSRIAALDSAGACGWVVDLRGNSGGNMWPMLAGVGPLLDAEVVGSFTNGRPGGGWHYRAGRSWYGDSTPPPLSLGWGTAAAHELREPSAPVAVLIGPRTASSGEMTLLAFLGRPRVRTFGDSTSGYASANVTVPLRDGAMLLVTSGYPRDRLGRIYPLKVAPDELVARDGSGSDAQPRRAAEWLLRDPACGGGGNSPSRHRTG